MISIVIPLYNSLAYLDRTLESAVNQTYTDTEIILVDDGSTDGSAAICDLWASKDPRIRVIHVPNGGVSYARNIGIREARGEFIYFLDSDDLMYPHCLEMMMERVKEHPDVEVVGGGCKCPEGSPIRFCDYEQSPYSLSQYLGEPDQAAYAILCRRSVAVMVTNRIIRRSFILDNSLFFIEGIINEDEVWLFKLSGCISSMAIVPENTMVYVVHEGSIMTSQFRYQNYPVIARPMAEMAGGSLQAMQVSSLFLFIFNQICHKETGLRIYDFSDSLRILYSKGTRRQRMGIWLLMHSPMPQSFRYVHGLRLPKKLVGKPKVWLKKRP